MNADAHDSLIYDWNVRGDEATPRHPVELNDESLRDGLQSPSVRDPSIAEKIEILQLMAELGIHSANLGLPGAGPRAYEHVLALAQEIQSNGLPLQANCAARTLRTDIEPIARVVQETGLRIEAAVFLGSSQIRQYVEDWDMDLLLSRTEKALEACRELGVDIMYVTEDTTRTHPEVVRRLYTQAIELGARRLVVCDTVGHATPNGVRQLIGFVRKIVEQSGEDVAIDWHGHRDRGLAVPNAIAAYYAGANRIHATALGIGERCGNCPMDTLLVNLKLAGHIDNELSALSRYCEAVANSVRIDIPRNYPIVGDDAFDTATGVHAAAVVKALRKGDTWLADRVYSGVPAAEVGREQKISVGYMSGRANVLHWLERHGYAADDDRVQRIFGAAKKSDHVLSDEELHGLARA